MRIVQIPRRFVASDWGGTETVVLETCKRLMKKGHCAEIYTTLALSDLPEEIMDGLSIKRFSYFYPYLGLSSKARRLLDQKGGNLFSFSLMKALLRCPPPDLLHLHTGKRLGGIGRYAALKRGIPYVISLHGGVLDVPADEAASWIAPTQGTWEWGKALGWWVGARRVVDDAAAILCVGQEEQRRMQERYPDKPVVFLPNGVDCQRFSQGDGAAFRQKYGIANDAFVLLTVGRIDPQKNQRAILDALPALLQYNPKIHALLIGHVTNDAYFQELNQIITNRGLNEHCTLIDGLPAGSRDLANAYHAADCFLLPSIHEPFGIVILEAWAAGLPVIASRVGGILSLIESGKDGVFIDPRNSPSVIQAVADLMQDENGRKGLAQAGYRKAVNWYDWDRITDSLIGVYEKIAQLSL